VTSPDALLGGFRHPPASRREIGGKLESKAGTSATPTQTHHSSQLRMEHREPLDSRPLMLGFARSARANDPRRPSRAPLDLLLFALAGARSAPRRPLAADVSNPASSKRGRGDSANLPSARKRATSETTYRLNTGCGHWL
jgi:hypothetical protein